MQSINCARCGDVLAYGRDTGDDLTTISVICVCGHTTNVSFLGYPNLFGTDKYYFEFVDENIIKCGLR